MADRPSLEEAFAAASAGLEDDAADEAQDDESQDPVAEEEEVESEESEEIETSDEDEGEEAESDESEEKGTAIPDSYFGVDLSNLPDDVKQEVYDSLRQKDSYTNRLSQEKSGLEKEVAELREFIQSRLGDDTEDEGPELDEEGNPTFEMPSDDEIVKYITEEYKLEEDDPFYEIQVKAALPGVKAAIAADVRNQQLQYQVQLAEYERFYNSSIDRLESEQGKLPLPRGEFLQWAAENDLGDPKEAYETFVTHAKGIIESKTADSRTKAEAAKAAAKRELKKKSAVQSRRSAAGTTENRTTKPSIEEAIAMAVKETGVSLD
jgi:hypothetical protein